MPFDKALEGSTKLHVQVQLKPQNLAGLPELCVVLSDLSGEDHHAQFFLDRGVVEYGKVRAEARESEPKRRRLETEAGCWFQKFKRVGIFSRFNFQDLSRS
jgi:hypothetical protein